MFDIWSCLFSLISIRPGCSSLSLRLKWTFIVWYFHLISRVFLTDWSYLKKEKKNLISSRRYLSRKKRAERSDKKKLERERKLHVTVMEERAHADTRSFFLRHRRPLSRRNVVRRSKRKQPRAAITPAALIRPLVPEVSPRTSWGTLMQ